MRHFLPMMTIFCALSFSAAAQADTLVTFSYVASDPSGNGADMLGNGTFDVDGNGNIYSITGTATTIYVYDGVINESLGTPQPEVITGLIDDYGDNIFNASGDPYFDLSGLSFTTSDGLEVDVSYTYYNGVPAYVALVFDLTGNYDSSYPDSFTGIAQGLDLTISQSPLVAPSVAVTPEPSSMILWERDWSVSWVQFAAGTFRLSHGPYRTECPARAR